MNSYRDGLTLCIIMPTFALDQALTEFLSEGCYQFSTLRRFHFTDLDVQGFKRSAGDELSKYLADDEPLFPKYMAQLYSSESMEKLFFDKLSISLDAQGNPLMNYTLTESLMYAKDAKGQVQEYKIKTILLNKSQ